MPTTGNNAGNTAGTSAGSAAGEPAAAPAGALGFRDSPAGAARLGAAAVVGGLAFPPVSAFLVVLLAFLAIEADRTHSRDALTGLLWPDWPQASARRSLSQALFNLRQVINDPAANPPYLLIDRQSVQWNRASAATVDVLMLEPLLCQPATALSNQQLE